jgi:hypothetical protein
MNHIDYNLSFTKREFQLLRLVLWVSCAALGMLERLGLLKDRELVAFATNLHDNLACDGIEPEGAQFGDVINAFDKVREGKVCVSQRKCPASFAAAYSGGPRLLGEVMAVLNADTKTLPLRPVSGRMTMRGVPLSIPKAATPAAEVFVIGYFCSALRSWDQSMNDGATGAFRTAEEARAKLHSLDWYQSYKPELRESWQVCRRIPQAAGYTYVPVYIMPKLSDSELFAASTVKAEPVTYKVQWNAESDRSKPGLWVDYRFEHCPDSGARLHGCTSRNEAYRGMRARLRTDRQERWAPHRVVPSTTPEGADKAGRGWYQVEYWARTHKTYKPCSGNVGYKHGPNRYDTAEDAQAAIDQYGCEGDSYRVKWHPSNK